MIAAPSQSQRFHSGVPQTVALRNSRRLIRWEMRPTTISRSLSEARNRVPPPMPSTGRIVLFARPLFTQVPSRILSGAAVSSSSRVQPTTIPLPSSMRSSRLGSHRRSPSLSALLSYPRRKLPVLKILAGRFLGSPLPLLSFSGFSARPRQFCSSAPFSWFSAIQAWCPTRLRIPTLPISLPVFCRDCCQRHSWPMSSTSSARSHC